MPETRTETTSKTTSTTGKLTSRTQPKTYEQYVADWVKIDNTAQWAKGDLLADLHTVYGENTLEKFADEVEIKLKTAQNLRRVAAAYPQKSRRRDIPWSVHEAFAAQDDRFELIASWTGTVADARTLVNKRREAESALDDADSKAETLAALPAGDRQATAADEDTTSTSGTPEYQIPILQGKCKHPASKAKMVRVPVGGECCNCGQEMMVTEQELDTLAETIKPYLDKELAGYLADRLTDDSALPGPRPPQPENDHPGYQRVQDHRRIRMGTPS